IAESIRTMLLVLFHRNSEVPEELSVNDFANMAVIVDKYELHSVFKGWISQWKSCCPLLVSRLDSPGFLMVGWVFRYADYFKEATNIICRYFVLTDDGNFEWQNSENGNLCTLMPETPEIVIRK